MKLQGRVALVTGASRGVGQATALELARRGADVVLSARTVDTPLPNQPGTLQETAEQVRALGREAFVVGADLNDPEAVERLAAEALAWKGRVDVLVNDAAFMGRAVYHSIDELELKNFVRQFNVNVTAPFLLAKALIPAMRANGGGTIVNVTSGTGLVGVEVTPGITYGATKAALNRLSTLMARDLEPDGIAVIAVCPGYTRTALVEQTAAQANQDLSEAHAPSVPANTIADLIEADLQITTGRVFQTMSVGPPRLMADGRAPMPEGVEIDLASVPGR